MGLQISQSFQPISVEFYSQIPFKEKDNKKIENLKNKIVENSVKFAIGREVFYTQRSERREPSWSV